MRFPTIIAVTLALSAVGLTYEIAAGRVLAPYFGTSLLTWTTVIATVLGGFSLGSALGGFVAERPRARALRDVRRSLVATAVLMAVSPMLLALLQAFGLRGTGGMLFSVIAVFFPASVFVTLPSPLLAKLAIEARPGREGSSLGIVMAAGSVGAIFGAVLAGFVTLPLIGGAATFAACGVVALICLAVVRSDPSDAGGAGIMTTGLAAVFVTLTGTASLPICQFESGLSCLRISQTDKEVRLYSDGVTQAAEALSGDDAANLALPYTEWMWSRLNADLGPAPSVLFIGGGGYTLPTKLLASRSEASAIAVEIDPLVTEVVKAHLPEAAAMIAREGYVMRPDDGETERRLALVHADGRVFLNETGLRFDAAVMDAFSSGSVPAHLVTLETYERLAEIVDGPVYVNLIDVPDGALARGVMAVLRQVYPVAEAIQGPKNTEGRSNILLMGSRRVHAPLADLPEGYQHATIGEARAFTDDRSWSGHR